MAFGIGTVTANAQKKTALPWPNRPYAGNAPGTSYGTSYSTPPTSSPAPPPATPAPTTVQGGLQQTTGTIDQAKGALTNTQPFLDNYLKPNVAGTTAFRQALTNTKASTTANAYDNAVSQARTKAAQMGFSSNSQPVTFGAETAIGNERAKAISDIPSQVNLEAQPVEFQAAQMQQNQSSLYNALANTQQGETNTLATQEAQKNAQKGALATGLAQTGLAVAEPFLKKLAGGGSSTPTTAPGPGPQPGDPNFVGPVQPASPKPGDPNFVGPVAGAATAGIGAALAGTSAAAATPAVSVVIPGVTDAIAGGAVAGAGGAAAGGAVAGEAGAAATEAGATTAAGGGLGSSLAALATNPVTWAVAGAIAAAIIWKKSQVHPTADTFVQGYQNPFGQHLGSVVDEFDKAFAGGQMTKEQAQTAYEQTASLIDQFKADTNAFAQKGSKENTVAHQAVQTMATNFGPNFEKILGKMQSEIAGLG